jgi:glycosyltransferase involved in cell wall biosynthesis
MKRITLVNNTSWNIYNFRMKLVSRLQQEGFEVYALAPEDAYTYRLLEAGLKFVPISMQGSGSNPLSEIRIIWQLYHAFRKIKPQLSLHYTIKPNVYGTVAAHLADIPSINNVSGLGTAFLNKNLVSRIAQNLYRTAFQLPTKVFFQNHDDQKLFQQLGLIGTKSRSEVLPGSGVDILRFQPNGQTSGEAFSFLMISRLLYDKGVVEYVEAARLLKEQGVDAHFQLLGAPDYGHRRGIPAAQLEAWRREKVIDYLGTTDDVRPFLHRADCVVLPSYREGTPRTLLEAASCGKPLLATDVPGCNNIVQDRLNGLLCQVRDANDLALKMLQMLDLPQEVRQEFGRQSRRIVESRFNENIVIDRYLAEIARLATT